jgi:hypothetical protein
MDPGDLDASKRCIKQDWLTRRTAEEKKVYDAI